MQALYHGESARTPYDRGQEHLSALEKGNKESQLMEHHMEHHPEEERSFTMTVDQFIPTPLWRQATEAHNIAQSRADIIMNRKGEWGENLPPC